MRRFRTGSIISNNELGTIPWEIFAWGGDEKKFSEWKILHKSVLEQASQEPLEGFSCFCLRAILVSFGAIKFCSF